MCQFIGKKLICLFTLYIKKIEAVVEALLITYSEHEGCSTPPPPPSVQWIPLMDFLINLITEVITSHCFLVATSIPVCSDVCEAICCTFIHSSLKLVQMKKYSAAVLL